MVDLRILEKEDLALFAEWVNNPDFYGDCDILDQRARNEIEKRFENSPPEDRKFVIQKKDGNAPIVAEQFVSTTKHVIPVAKTKKKN